MLTVAVVGCATSGEDAVDTAGGAQTADLGRTIRLVGTLADDPDDPTVMQLRTLHDHTYALYGDTTATYKEIRAALPAHDYARTLFAVVAVQDRGTSTRWRWLDYAPVPFFACTQVDQPGTHLDLVDVKPDGSLLDGFVTTPIAGREVKVGAHAACTQSGAAYACAFDSIGTPWATADLKPSATPFEVVVTRADEAHTTLPFTCTAAVPGRAPAASED